MTNSFAAVRTIWPTFAQIDLSGSRPSWSRVQATRPHSCGAPTARLPRLRVFTSKADTSPYGSPAVRQPLGPPSWQLDGFRQSDERAGLAWQGRRGWDVAVVHPRAPSRRYIPAQERLWPE